MEAVKHSLTQKTLRKTYGKVDKDKEHKKRGTNLLRGKTLRGNLGLELILFVSSLRMDEEATLRTVPRNPFQTKV